MPPCCEGLRCTGHGDGTAVSGLAPWLEVGEEILTYITGLLAWECSGCYRVRSTPVWRLNAEHWVTPDCKIKGCLRCNMKCILPLSRIFVYHDLGKNCAQIPNKRSTCWMPGMSCNRSHRTHCGGGTIYRSWGQNPRHIELWPSLRKVAWISLYKEISTPGILQWESKCRQPAAYWPMK